MPDPAATARAAAQPAAAVQQPATRPQVGGNPGPTIAAGACHVMFAYDIGLSIDLAHAARRVGEAIEPAAIGDKRRTPTAFEFRPVPLRLLQSGPALTIAGFATSPRVECVLFDFGAVSVTYAIPLSGPLEGLLPLSDALYANATLLADSRRRVERLLAAIAPAVAKPSIADLVEDYSIFQIESLMEGGSAAAPEELLERHGHTVARILRAEPGQLSGQEIQDALSTRIAYAPGEQAILDWNAALLFQRNAEDARAVLEYANVELLELRRLDDQLDAALDQSFASLGRRTFRDLLRLSPGRELRAMAELQTDSAMLFEGVNNAIKLIGDQYLARLYRHAAQRLHLPEWDASILRKLQTAESIYQKLSDHESSRRTEILEWIIILLILFEVVMSFVR